MDYVTAIGLGFPGVQVSCSGDPEIYENIVWEQGLAIPNKETLDAWITSNATSTTKKISVLAFRNRFTQTEKITLELAALDNPTAPMQSRQLAASLRVLLADLTVASHVDLSNPGTIAGVQALETYNIIGAGRTTVILETPPTADEQYMVSHT